MGSRDKTRPSAFRQIIAQWALATFIVGLIPQSPIIASNAAADEGGGAESVNPGFDPTMPPQFNLATVAGQGQLFQSCNSALQGAVSQSIQNLGELAQNMSSQNPAINALAGAGGAANAGFGINAVCNGPDQGPSVDSLSCESLTLPDGRIDDAALKSKAMAIENALNTIKCKKGKFEAVKGELNCLTTQADMLSQQLTSIQGAYQTNIQRMQQDVQKINQVVADRISEDGDVLQRLNGSGSSTDSNGNTIPGNGSKGLLAVRDGLCQALTGAPCGSTGGASGGGSGGGGGGMLNGTPDQASIPGQIQTIKDQMVDVQNKQQQLVEAVNERQMGLAAECFNNRKVPQFQCVKNGPPVSVHEYVLCMYQQKLGIDSNGQIESSALNAKGIKATQNQAKEQALSALLDQIMSDVPQKQQAPTQPGQMPDVSTMQAATILTAADVESQYGSQLSGYDTGNTPIHDFVMKNITACFTRAQNVVNQEKNMASSPIGQQQAAVQKAQDDLKVNANQMLSGNVSRFEEAMTALTGMNMPLNTAKCTNATPAVQVACLQDLQQNMEALLHGSAKQSTVVMHLSGTDPNTNISFTCQGLDGCIAALQNVDRNLKTEVKRVSAFKQQYVTAAKQSVDNFTKQMAAMMSSQSAALNGRLKMMNAALSSLGVSGGISIPKVECEPEDYDQDGLPKPPASSLKLIGCKMNPPMLDVSGNDFSSSLSGVSDGERALDDKLGPLAEARGKLASLQNSCLNQAIGKKLEKAQADADLLASGNCQYEEAFCQSKSAVGNITNDLSNVEGISLSTDLVSNVTSALDSGMSACSKPDALKVRWVIGNCQGDAPRGVNAEDAAKAREHGDFCNAMIKTTASPAAYCSSITNRIRRDIANVGAMTGGSGSAGGARP